MLEHRLTDIEDPAIQILRHLASYDDVQLALNQRGLIKKLVSLMNSRKHETSSGAILTMLSIFPHPPIRSVAVKEGVVATLINHLKHQQKCLFAAYALSLIMDYDDIRKAMSELSVPDSIVSAVVHGSFNGTVENEHGKVVLGRLMHNDDLRAAVIKTYTTAALCAMFRKGELALNHAAVDFLDIMAKYPDGKEVIKESKDAIFHAIVGTAHHTWNSQKHAAMALRTLFGIQHSSERSFVTKEFQPVILAGLPDILRLLKHEAVLPYCWRALYMLTFLKETVRARVREHEDFKCAKGKYFSKTMKLQYHSSDPREEDVHKLLDKLFEAMEEGTDRRSALKFPEVHPIPRHSPLVTSLAILSCVLYIPCGLSLLLTGLAIDKTESSPT
ncbi:uncharacterized protein EDB91DRAFT_1338315 [Suillus paluster]|uniref:uncharacterized protein n=1 Tax=Suillus paluster TaxID=48578 RepID=UPI001B8826F0|nr:uncharacterized protein EDB91DRAFT_1338315 [Suillus paluster]KAG1732688.1 hypothetical protein EDB91DRAFT_1338315 [Suillus paluster]